MNEFAILVNNFKLASKN